MSDPDCDGVTCTVGDGELAGSKLLGGELGGSKLIGGTVNVGGRGSRYEVTAEARDGLFLTALNRSCL